MLLERWFHKLPLKARLIWSYLVILAIGGLATSLVGSWIVSSTIMMQARRAVSHDYATARTIYDERLESLRLAIQFASGGSEPDRNRLEAIRKEAALDVVDIAREPGSGFASLAVVREALAGRAAAATEVLPAAVLAAAHPALGERARVGIAGNPAGEVPAMALVAAAPLRGPGGEIAGALYGAVLLNRNFALVDHVWKLVSSSERQQAGDDSSISIFHKDVRISTSVRDRNGARAVGTSVAPEISRAVLREGLTWRGRAYILNDWHIGEYGPIRDGKGEIAGMLAVALRENTYTSIRNRVILSFFGIALVGFLVIIGITYYMIRSITRPIGEMVAATRNITAGRFDQEVRSSDSSGEIALLADSFNAMLHSLRQMKGDLEEWGRTLELKVKQRTEQLVAMQARVAQSERLASLGMLAAGVAHEVNNPLGGILALSALTLENMDKDHPDRENLEEVIRQTDRCRDIVRRLLEFSRQSKGHMARLDLNRILNETLSLMTRQAQFFNIQVVTELDPDLPAVMADRSQFQQVFMNILLNAAHAMNERGVITICTRVVPSEGVVEAAISDTGCGIPPDQVDRIFDPFFTTKASGQGTGLGLSIAYGIITTHGGTIAVESRPGAGSTFRIRMPALPAAAAAE